MYENSASSTDENTANSKTRQLLLIIRKERNTVSILPYPKIHFLFGGLRQIVTQPNVTTSTIMEEREWAAYVIKKNNIRENKKAKRIYQPK